MLTFSGIFVILVSVFVQLAAESGSDINFYLYYDKKDPSLKERLEWGNQTSLWTSHFVVGAPVIFLTHGFHNSFEQPFSSVQPLKNAYLQMGYVNIIATDWQHLSGARLPLSLAALSYIFIEQNAALITGHKICDLILLLIKAQFISGPEQVHLIGHSLGAHISGIAGTCVKDKLGTGALVGRITGLDPSGTLYSNLSREQRLDAGDGAFVDILHTDSGILGSSLELGTVDFYANGGGRWRQPGCFNQTLDAVSVLANAILGFCSHSRSVAYFLRSILRMTPELYGCKCGDTARVRANKFLNLVNVCASPNPQSCHDKILFGQHVPRAARGKLYIKIDVDLPGLGLLPQTPLAST